MKILRPVTIFAGIVMLAGSAAAQISLTPPGVQTAPAESKPAKPAVICIGRAATQGFGRRTEDGSTDETNVRIAFEEPFIHAYCKEYAICSRCVPFFAHASPRFAAYSVVCDPLSWA